MAKNEMVGWHHQCNGHEFEQTLGDGEGHESLSCCSPWGHKKSDMTVNEQQQQGHTDRNRQSLNLNPGKVHALGPYIAS